MSIIGLTGPEGSGKKTCAKYLETLGYKVVSLSEPIQWALCALFGWDRKLWDDEVWKEATIQGLDTTPAQLARTLGFDWGRGVVSPRIWIVLLSGRIKGMDKIVIPNVRFDDEAEFILAYGGRILSVKRDGFDNLNYGMRKPVNELYISGQLNNNSSIPQLKKQINIAITFGR